MTEPQTPAKKSGQVTPASPEQERARRAQELLRKYVPAGVSLADELIAERRREAESERD